MLSVVGYNEAYLRTLKRYGAGAAPVHAPFSGETWTDPVRRRSHQADASQPTPSLVAPPAPSGIRSIVSVDKKPIWLVRRAFSWFLWLIRQFFFFIGCISVVYPGTQLWLLALVRQFAADAGILNLLQTSP